MVDRVAQIIAGILLVLMSLFFGFYEVLGLFLAGWSGALGIIIFILLLWEAYRLFWPKNSKNHWLSNYFSH